MYALGLVVDDGVLDSQPSTMTVTAVEATVSIITELQELVLFTNGLSSSELKQKAQRGKLTNQLNAVILEVESGNYVGAFDLLREQVHIRFDGCSPAGVVDGND
jgi:hypothetical protein